MAQEGVKLASIDEQKSLSQDQQQEVRISIPVQRAPHRGPCQDLLNGTRIEYNGIAIPLYEASLRGDWKAAKEILDKRPELVRYSITENGETALHVAASAESTKEVEEFVKNLMHYMKNIDLELQDNSGNTALCIVAAAGNVRMVEIMVKKNRALMIIPGGNGMMPLYMVALFRNYEVVKYMYYNSPVSLDEGWTTRSRGMLLKKCAESDMFDIALQIVKDHPELGRNRSVLGILAQKPDAFSEKRSGVIMSTLNVVLKAIGLKVGAPQKETEALQLLRVIWEYLVQMSRNEIDSVMRGRPDDHMIEDNKPHSYREDRSLLLPKLISDNIVKMPVEIRNIIKEPPAAFQRDPNVASQANEKTKYSSRILFIAAKVGNTRFIIEFIRLYPDLIGKVNDNNQSIFHTAAEHRHNDIYNLLYEIGSRKDQITLLKDDNDNNMLHLIGKIPKKKPLDEVSGAAFEMQHELLWFNEVEKMVPLAYREERNKDGLTPHELFTKEHKDLVAKGEDWMKGTARQCMVVAALIATIVFAAAFSIPGGYSQNDGIPIFYRKATFIVFIVADAISLFSSSASIIMFLSILTSRYAERDFYESLPKKLFLGLATLLLSITTMMATFSVSFFILYHRDLKWIPILVTLFASMSVFLFARLQYPLLKDVFRSTYGARYLFQPKKRVLYEKRALPFISRCTSKILKLL